MPTNRRFPPPWTVEDMGACFVVMDNNGQKLAAVYYKDFAYKQRRGAKDCSQRCEASPSMHDILRVFDEQHGRPQVAKKGKKSKQRKRRTKPGAERKFEERKSEKERADEAVDEAEEESFPASDAPAYPDFK